MTAAGKKFGKSEGNAIWINSEKTSQYDMYQYFMNTNDSDLEKCFKYFTFYDNAQIKQV